MAGSENGSEQARYHVVSSLDRDPRAFIYVAIEGDTANVVQQTKRRGMVVEEAIEMIAAQITTVSRKHGVDESVIAKRAFEKAESERQ